MEKISILIKDQHQNLHFVFNMQIILNIPDREVFTLTHMPDLSRVMDKAYKASRPEMLRTLAHERKVFVSFQVWYLSMTPEQREATMKNIKSTLSIDDFVEKGILDREFVIEAVERIREQQDEEDSSSEVKSDN